MPSMRRSLIAYFLALMALSLGAVATYVRHFVSGASAERERALSERIRDDLREREREATARFDRELLGEARTLAREFGRSYLAAAGDRTRLGLSFLSLGVRPHPLARAASAALAESPGLRPTRVNVLLALESAAEADPVARRVYDPGDHFAGALFQIHLPRPPRPGGEPPPGGVGFGVTVHAPDQAFDLPFDPGAFERDSSFLAEPARVVPVEVPERGRFRAAVLRSPIGPQPPRPGGPFGGGAGRRDGPTGPRPQGERPEQAPGIYVLFARRAADLDSQLAAHRRAADDALAELALRTEVELGRAWIVLGALGGVLSVALPVGSWYLVGRGLRPLSKLTHAVSRVSERDFRLGLRADELSTELAPIHDRLTQTLGALGRAFEREKQAVADISHELRTPLAALRTTLDVALRKPRDAGQYKGTLEDCRDITKQLSRLVDRILTLATLDADRADASRVPVNVAELAAECVAVIRPLAEGHGLSFDATLDPKAVATTDADQLREVMMNLLHNAVEYNRPGGSIHLAVTKVADGVRLSVRDTGIGMTPEVQAKIFERFYRADPSRHATGVHAGLGLAIVKEYVERLRGELTVASEAGVGSKFEVAVPGA